MSAMLTALRVTAACAVAAVAGHLRLQDPIPATMHEMAAWVGIAFFGTLWLTGALRSSRDKGAS